MRKIKTEEERIKHNQKCNDYYHANKDRIKNYYKNLPKQRKVKRNQSTKDWKKRTNYGSNFINKIIRSLSIRAHRAMKSKIGKSFLEIGCTKKQLIKHLESKFKNDMTWENYGKVWQIDHIRPVWSFNVFDEKEAKMINNFENLQPLYNKDNTKKGSEWGVAPHPSQKKGIF